MRKNICWPGVDYGRLCVIFSIAYSYIALAYPGNVLANWLVLGRVPSALSSPIILPTYLVAWFVVHFSPGDVVYRICSKQLPYYALDAIAALDNMTTGLGYMEYAAETSMNQGRGKNVGNVTLPSNNSDRRAWCRC